MRFFREDWFNYKRHEMFASQASVQSVRTCVHRLPLAVCSDLFLELGDRDVE